MAELGFVRGQRLDRDVRRVRVDAGRVSPAVETYQILDVAVIPLTLAEPFRDHLDNLEVSAEPLPLVVAVRRPRRAATTSTRSCRSTGDEGTWSSASSPVR